ncbi:MAG: hypothetical protein MJ025_07010 [Victivallaceae bacterium]|nr:hypothetical protein [Victivallaceae bacterium]
MIGGSGKKWDTPLLRISIIGAVMAIGIAVLALKTYSVQIGSGEKHRAQASRQSIRRIRIPAKRGKIISADGRILADNLIDYGLVFYVEEMRLNRKRKTIRRIMDAASDLAGYIGRENPLTEAAINRHLNNSPGLPLPVMSHIGFEDVAKLEERMRRWPGAEIVAEPMRVYPFGALACHILGTSMLEAVGSAADRREFSYYLPDIVGRNGIEKQADTVGVPGVMGLRGKPGHSLVQVDHLGYVHRTLLDKMDPQDGNNIVLTIDTRAQKIAESLLQYYRGAIVVLDAGNGDVLAAASSPRFDLRMFHPVLTREYYKMLLEDEKKPLFNRAFNGSYTPGSILKPLTSLAFLESGLDPEQYIACNGFNKIGNAVIRCAAFRRGGHGSLNLSEAIKYSCNSYMISCSKKYGLEPIARIMESAGIGRRTGLELSDTPGVFPSDANKRKNGGAAWNRYDTALLSMGQGTVTVSPLQAAIYTAAIANGGYIYRPKLVKYVINPRGVALHTRVPEVMGHLAASEENLAFIREAMRRVVNDGDGSGRLAKVHGLKIHGKTGSAEIGHKPNLKINAWFVAFVTHEGRTYSIAILLEDARSGGSSCAPLCADFFEKYLLDK